MLRFQLLAACSRPAPREITPISSRGILSRHRISSGSRARHFASRWRPRSSQGVDIGHQNSQEFGPHSLTLRQQCSYNETYNTLKIEKYGVVVTFEHLA